MNIQLCSVRAEIISEGGLEAWRGESPGKKALDRHEQGRHPDRQRVDLVG